MSNYAQDREAAWQLLNEYVKSETLLRHSLTVEAVMRHFATLYLEDPNIWGNIGLLHDIDYEMYPDQHCRKTREILTPKELSDEFIRAIESHGYGLVHHVEPRENVEKVLFTIDELTGLISATALLRPSKSIHDLTTKSVKRNGSKRALRRMSIGKSSRREPIASVKISRRLSKRPSKECATSRWQSV